MTDLAQKHCAACSPGTPPLAPERARELLPQIPEWAVDGNRIRRTYRFGNYYETIAFVNAAAWISHREDHHPDLTVGYNRCEVVYWTHAVNGLSENDFICAAKLDQLLKL